MAESLFVLRACSLVTEPLRVYMLDILGCSPKFSHTFNLVAIGYGAHLSSLPSVFGFTSFSLDSTQ